MITLKKYYFTFDLNHKTKKGLLMKDRYVTVVAQSYTKATQLFDDVFCKHIMPWPMQFKKQFSEESFDSKKYSKGQYTIIKQWIQ